MGTCGCSQHKTGGYLPRYAPAPLQPGPFTCRWAGQLPVCVPGRLLSKPATIPHLNSRSCTLPHPFSRPTGHNLSQLVLGSLFDKGLAWALDEPLGRSAFPLVCLGPFLSKLSPSEAERVAGVLSQRVEEVGLQEEDEERQQLEAFLGHLQVRVFWGRGSGGSQD